MYNKIVFMDGIKYIGERVTTRKSNQNKKVNFVMGDSQKRILLKRTKIKILFENPQFTKFIKFPSNKFNVKLSVMVKCDKSRKIL